MKNKHTAIVTVTAFLLGFGLGGLSLHYASAQGMFGLSTSVSQLGVRWWIYRKMSITFETTGFKLKDEVSL